jgi:hypothetical protein
LHHAKYRRLGLSFDPQRLQQPITLADEPEFEEFHEIQDFVDANIERIELLSLKRSPWSPRLP